MEIRELVSFSSSALDFLSPTTESLGVPVSQPVKSACYSFSALWGQWLWSSLSVQSPTIKSNRYLNALNLQVLDEKACIFLCWNSSVVAPGKFDLQKCSFQVLLPRVQVSGSLTYWGTAKDFCCHRLASTVLVLKSELGREYCFPTVLPFIFYFWTSAFVLISIWKDSEFSAYSTLSGSH